MKKDRSSHSHLGSDEPRRSPRTQVLAFAVSAGIAGCLAGTPALCANDGVLEDSIIPVSSRAVVGDMHEDGITEEAGKVVFENPLMKKVRVPKQEEVPLIALLEYLSRKSGVPIVLADKSIRETKISNPEVEATPLVEVIDLLVQSVGQTGWNFQNGTIYVGQPQKIPGSYLNAYGNEGPVGVWLLETGKDLHDQILGWGKGSGWTIEWNLSKTWEVPAPAKYEGTLDRAIEDVVKNLYDSGHDIHVTIWEGNRVIRIEEKHVK